jgi:predicted transposase YbfD/YdcC
MAEQKRSFYLELQSCKELDLRDNRGKRHNLAFTLFSLCIALLRKRDGNLSSLHRSMQNKHSELCACLGIEGQRAISRSHLPVLLGKVCRAAFERLLFAHYGIELKPEERLWFAADGKELRGSIEKGDKRGEAIVQLVRHGTREVAAQTYYNGQKESEKTYLKELLEQSGLHGHKVTMDALHLSPSMTELVAGKEGTFIIGLKDNQAALAAEMSAASQHLDALNQMETLEKGHGRIEKRHYRHYDISDCHFDGRWEKAEFKSLFKVERERNELKPGKVSQETSYYISNVEPVADEDCFHAIREHWGVETNNHLRDVTLKEDHLRSKKTILSGQ